MADEIAVVIAGLMEDRSIPRNIKCCLKDSLDMLNISCTPEEKISSIVSALDEASADPNVPMHARTMIWNAISVLEGIKSDKF
ncbi:MAG: hypothetical protein FJY76_03550 [Candidatus Aenigmarchaeota archaeon]|nr:hypothetical protein [Candidatus Aenigmarchaeota archaeon]